jgi:hypothetical protein
MLSKRLPFFLGLLSSSVFILLMLVPMSQQGMSYDGIVYAALSKNMALGVGSVWSPSYSQTIWHHFYEHPALALYFQSLYFKILGQGYIVERFYALTMALLQLSVVCWLWCRTQKPEKHSYPLLLLLWVLVPLNVLAYKHNYLDGTATFFSSVSSALLIVFYSDTKLKKIGLLSLVTFFLGLGFFSNGPVYLFPLVIPLLQAFILKQRSYRQAFIDTVVLMVLLVLFGCCFFWLFPEAKDNMMSYLNTQVFASLKGKRITPYTGFGHFYILVHFLRAYWLATLITLMLIGTVWRQHGLSTVCANMKKREGYFYLCLALLSSMPVGVSPRQLFHYIIPSAPFYVLALMCFAYPAWCALMKALQKKITAQKVLAGFSSFLFIISITYLTINVGAYSRHENILRDIERMKKTVRQDEILDASFKVRDLGIVGAYFARASFISLDNGHTRRYYLSLKKERSPKGYKSVPIEMVRFSLWKKID